MANIDAGKYSVSTHGFSPSQHRATSDSLHYPNRDIIPNLPQSPWPERLHDHTLPSQPEIHAILAQIDKAEEVISLLDEDVSLLSELLQHLTTRRKAFHDHVQEHRRLISPLRRLPDELMSDIFVEYYRQKRASASDLFIGQHALQPILRTSRRWRAVAMSTPELWTSVRMTFKATPLDEIINHVKRLLERSRQRPLAISLDLMNVEPPESADRCVDAITPHFPRIQHLDLRLLTERSFDGVGNGAFPSLLSLRIGFPGRLYHSQPPIPRVWRVFEDCPSLQSVHILSSPPHRMVLSLPYEQLTKFVSGPDISLPASNCFGILQKCTSIKEFIVHKFISTADPISQVEVVLPHLHTFAIQTSSDLIGVFDRLTMPSLRILRIHFVAFDLSAPLNVGFIAEFVSFITRTACRIEVLEIDGKLPVSHLIAALETLPHLRELRVGLELSQDDLGVLLRRLAVVNDAEGIIMCPLLQRIHFKEDLTLQSYRQLMDMVHCRSRAGKMPRPSVARLMSLRVALDAQPGSSLDDLLYLQQDGFEIAVQARDSSTLYAISP